MDNTNNCTGCNICSMVCPDFAISIVSIEEEVGKEEKVERV